MLNKNKKGQFYLIAAMIIIFIIVGFAGISTKLGVKKEPQKFYDVGQILKSEGIQVVDYTNYDIGANLNTNVGSYLDLFANYTQDNINEDFSMIILYGDVVSGNIDATGYSRTSGGGVSYYLGGETAPLSVQSVGPLNKTQYIYKVNPDNTVDITLIGESGNITQTLPILSDNNFMFVMTTSSGFNQYIQSSQDLN